LETVIHHLFLAKNEKQKLKDLMAIFDLIERFREEQDGI
jgi:hypothetical protein